MRTVKSKPGMTQEDALLSLQKSARTSGEEIVSFRLRGNRWVAQLQHIAEFPPKDDEPKDEEPTEEPAFGESDDEESDGPPKDEAPDSDEGDDDKSPFGDDSKDQGPEGEKGEEKGELASLLSLVHQIADKLGIIPGGHEDSPIPGDEGPLGPPPPGPGPDEPDLGSAGKDGHLPTKMKQGEVLPHQTPIGAPAFASTHTAQIPGQVAPAPQAQAPVGPPCGKCGGPTAGGLCPTCTSAAGALQASVIDPNQIVGKKRVIEARVDKPMSESDAYRQANAAFKPHGYSVSQLVPQTDGTWLAVLQG